MQVSKRNNTALTLDQVALIKALIKAGGNQTSLAKQFGVSRATISRIANNHTWIDI